MREFVSFERSCGKITLGVCFGLACLKDISHGCLHMVSPLRIPWRTAQVPVLLEARIHVNATLSSPSKGLRSNPFIHYLFCCHILESSFQKVQFAWSPRICRHFHSRLVFSKCWRIFKHRRVAQWLATFSEFKFRKCECGRLRQMFVFERLVFPEKKTTCAGWYIILTSACVAGRKTKLSSLFRRMLHSFVMVEDRQRTYYMSLQ